MHVNDLLKIAVESGASDLHLKVGSYPMMRLRGSLTPASEEKRLEHDDMVAMAAAVLPTSHREKFKENHEVDLAYSVAGLGRFRCNAFQQRGTIGMIFRVIPIKVRSVDELDLPAILKKIAEEERGLVLVTGTTGSGKSTTLASMIDLVNREMPKHIVTIEDPIEFLHRDEKSIVNQREVGTDTASFSRALRRVLRQDPDIILIGEIRDSETAQIALSAAETGHLVLSTLHTLDATETVNRMIELFPPHERSQVRAMLAGTLQGIIGQRLLRTKDGEGRAAACEVLVTTGRIADFIMDPDQTGQIQEAIAEGEYYGMQTFDQALVKLVEEDRVSYEEALKVASRPQDFRLMVQSLGLGMTR
jgi:twitching motility protein PilT